MNNVSLVYITKEHINRVVFNRLNEHYKEIIKLCSLFIDNIAIYNNLGETTFFSFTVDMNRLFEKFIENYIKSKLKIDGIEIDTQSKEYIDYDNSVKVKPDIRVRYNTRDIIIIDTKYKIIKDDELKYNDFYQILSYCSTFEVERGILLYGEGKETNYEIRNNNIIISNWVLDLTGDPKAFNKKCDAFIKRLEKLIRRYQTKLI